MKRVESVVVVGSSGSGKTTLVNGLRTPDYNNKVILPLRHITRPPRLGDDLRENTHTDLRAFDAAVKNGGLRPAWVRPLDNGRVENYGFEAVDPDESRLRVYSANNAILRDINPTVEEVLASGLVVVVMASGTTRSQRLEERSPDMSASEKAVRLSDSGADMLDASVPIETIDTSGLSPAEGQLAFLGIVDSILASRA